MALMLTLLTSILLEKYVEVLVMMSVLVPIGMMNIYKTSVYLEDFFFCTNEMNCALIFMTLSLALLILISSCNMPGRMYTCLQISLLAVLVLCFSTNNLLSFYIFFETSLIPILLMIIGWGYQPERLQAGMYMIMYTVLGSLPLLVVIVYMFNLSSSLNLYMMSLLNLFSQNNLLVIGILAFLVKLPLYSLHVWLPKAHVEAPLGGSMILAGALLKLGGYGLFVFSAFCFYSLTYPVIQMIISLSLWGALFAALLCLSQSDIKSMIAYSSVVHMALVIVGILSGTSWGQICALLTMIAHGWASSALFCVASMSYEKVNSRSFTYTKGILKLYPILSLFWFILVMVNMAVPPTINFVGELLAIPVAMLMNIFYFMVLLMVLFLSVGYNMFLYSKINHGESSPYLLSSSGISSAMMLSFFGHILPLSLIFSLNFMTLCTENCIMMLLNYYSML